MYFLQEGILRTQIEKLLPLASWRKEKEMNQKGSGMNASRALNRSTTNPNVGNWHGPDIDKNSCLRMNGTNADYIHSVDENSRLKSAIP